MYLNVCVYVCVFMYSRTIALVELMFLLIKPTLNKVYFTLLYFVKHMSHYLRTTDSQFAYEKGYSTEMCIFC